MAKEPKVKKLSARETEERLKTAEAELEAALHKHKVTACEVRIARGQLDLANAMKEGITIARGHKLTEIDAAQDEVNKREKVVSRKAAAALEAKNTVDKLRQDIAQIMTRQLPLFDESPEESDGGESGEGEESGGEE